MSNLRRNRTEQPAALFLDIDGTLVDLVPTLAVVRVPNDLAPLLTHVSATLEGALAIVSGRPIAGVDAITAPLRLPAAGVHGALRLAPGGRVWQRPRSRQDSSKPSAPWWGTGQD